MSDEPHKRFSKKRGQIMDTATTLFTRFGIRRVTVEEICRKAGASKMTFYKFFPNKIELLKEIWNGWLDEGYEKLYKIDALDIPFREKMQKLIEYKIELGSRMSPEFIEESLHTNPEMKEFMEEIRAKNYHLFLDFVTSAQEKSDIRKMRPEFILAVMNKLYELVQDDDLWKIYPDYTEFVREVNSFFFFGILPTENTESR